MGHIERDLWVERQDPRDPSTTISLYALMRIPEGALGQLPAVICSHGFTANHTECDPYAIALAEAGITTIALDFFGGGMGIRSDGTLLDMTVETEADDLTKILSSVQALDWVDPARIGLLGCSQGGFVSTMVASRRPDEVAGLSLMYPAFVLHDDALRLYPEEEGVPDTYLAFPGYEPSRIARAYNLVARATDPYPLMARYAGPTLIAHGTADAIVPLAYSERAEQTFPDARLEVIEGGTHGFEDACLTRAVGLVCDFFGQVL